MKQCVIYFLWVFVLLQKLSGFQGSVLWLDQRQYLFLPETRHTVRETNTQNTLPSVWNLVQNMYHACCRYDHLHKKTLTAKQRKHEIFSSANYVVFSIWKYKTLNCIVCNSTPITICAAAPHLWPWKEKRSIKRSIVYLVTVNDWHDTKASCQFYR